jgi:UDP-2,3-diacylglucosamine hydrolase
MTSIFISDLHLDASRPAATDCFLQFLEESVAPGDQLYILGDLFEAWIGDDGATAHDRRVIAALARLDVRRITCRFLPGNRDFLVSARFADEASLSLLGDENVVTVDGRQALLMHGDTLCTDDHDYQRYRRIVRNPALQAAYLGLPIGIRRAIARAARRRSAAAGLAKPPAIMDVNQSAVEAALARHGADLLIHGHTHRPGIHRFTRDGRENMRVVLGDWYQQGSVLRWAGDGPRLSALPFA